MLNINNTECKNVMGLSYNIELQSIGNNNIIVSNCFAFLSLSDKYMNKIQYSIYLFDGTRMQTLCATTTLVACTSVCVARENQKTPKAKSYKQCINGRSAGCPSMRGALKNNRIEFSESNHEILSRLIHHFPRHQETALTLASPMSMNNKQSHLTQRTAQHHRHRIVLFCNISQAII